MGNVVGKAVMRNDAQEDRDVLLSGAKAMRRALRLLIERGEPLHIPNIKPDDALARIEAMIARMEGKPR